MNNNRKSIIIFLYGILAFLPFNLTVLGQPNTIYQEKQLEGILSRTMPSIESDLRSFKNRFQILLDKTGITAILNDLKALLQQQCDFLATDLNTQNDLKQSAQINMQLQTYMKTPEYQTIAQKEQEIIKLRKNRVLSYEQGQKLQDLEEEVKQLGSLTMKPLITQSRSLDKTISDRLSPFMKKIQNSVSRIQSILTTNAELRDFSDQLNDFIENVPYQTLSASDQNQLVTLLKSMRTTQERSVTSSKPCVGFSVGVFVSPEKFLQMVNSYIVSTLLGF